MQLLPFSLSELQHSHQLPATIESLLFTGCYPPIYDRNIPPASWLSDYIMAYIERDVRQLVNVHNLATFRRFLQMCAARTGQLLNLSNLASDCGITHNTAKSWLAVLEASYILFLLPPHFRNFNKRSVKTPKLYFYDTGVACALLSIQKSEQLIAHPMRGMLFETWVTSELMKSRFNQGLPANYYFWRDNQNHEVDILIDQGDSIIPVEVKSGLTITSDYFSGLQYWQTLNGKEPSGWLVYAGDQVQQRQHIKVIGWKQLESLLQLI